MSALNGTPLSLPQLESKANLIKVVKPRKLKRDYKKISNIVRPRFWAMIPVEDWLYRLWRLWDSPVVRMYKDLDTMVSPACPGEVLDSNPLRYKSLHFIPQDSNWNDTAPIEQSFKITLQCYSAHSQLPFASVSLDRNVLALRRRSDNILEVARVDAPYKTFFPNKARRPRLKSGILKV